ncbi:MAG TPA: MlaA family lipoprotein [Thermodesulfobacteriota bacterium]|nr:MlaA family lipoprotein [Thermodesulfobacteriota bacterium]
MKFLRWVCFLLVLYLISLPGPSRAEDLTSPSLSEASPAPSLSGETIPTPGATGPFEPSTAVEPSTSSHPTEAPTSSEQDDGASQDSVESEPLEPAPSEPSAETIADPIEPVNRAFFNFNDKLYFWVFKPVATGYKAVIPEDGRLGIRNFFSNLTTPVRLINCLFQANFKSAGNETLRFVINTTYGLGGFLDTAKKEFKIEKREADFGQTLGIWGMAPVFYLDLPILGPLSLRDGLGFAVDAALNPQTYLAIVSVGAGYANTGGWILDKINEASLTLGEYESLKKAALDPYIAVREAYYQYRQNKIKK